jgi:hypothetical protein
MIVLKNQRRLFVIEIALLNYPVDMNAFKNVTIAKKRAMEIANKNATET